jgi:hypothetical protein
VPEEMASIDRNEFDDEILRAYGIEEYKHQINDSLKTLYQIRTQDDS